MGGGEVHAALWSGTPASFVDLHPFGEWTYSYAFGASGGQQVGYTIVATSGLRHASLWTGSAASWVDLNPPGAKSSQANGVGNGQQVGFISFPSFSKHAALWTGAAASYVDLNPAGITVSEALGASSGQQVGYVLANRRHACLWSGTADSFVDLHAFLPPDFDSSTAEGTWQDSGHTYVVGWGTNDITFRDEALLWIAAHDFGPSSYSIFRGTLALGGLSDLIESDDQRLVVQTGITLSAQEAPIIIRFDAVSPFAEVSQLKLRIESQVTTVGLVQGIDLFDYDSNDWVSVDVHNASFSTDNVVTVSAPNPNRFIQAGTRAMKAQVKYWKTGPTLSSTWQAKLDQVQWEMSP